VLVVFETITLPEASNSSFTDQSRRPIQVDIISRVPLEELITK